MLSKINENKQNPLSVITEQYLCFSLCTKYFFYRNRSFVTEPITAISGTALAVFSQPGSSSALLVLISCITVFLGVQNNNCIILTLPFPHQLFLREQFPYSSAHSLHAVLVKHLFSFLSLKSFYLVCFFVTPPMTFLIKI